MNNIIDINIRNKTYRTKKEEIVVLTNFHLKVRTGEKISIVGESGAGKSSLLNILGLIDRDYFGEYVLFGSRTKSLREEEMAQLRNQKIGFVLQESALINSMSIEDNIKLPLVYLRSKKRTCYMEYYKNIIETIGIKHILGKKPLECSGGEKSRAVFARGIIMQPEIILADEPTASLDEINSNKIINLLFDINKEFNTTIITVTHDIQMANMFDKVIRIERM